MGPTARACPSCRNTLPDEAQFCMHCGAATPTEPGVPARTMATGPVEVARVRTALASRYKVERVLGQGGMATVYLAEDLKHHRKVAVKVMRPELAATLGADRFLREVEFVGQLSHPHVLPMYDSGEANGFLYYVMPYVDGESLGARVKRDQTFPVEETVRLAREIADALAYAHARGIIHRDIKPANVLLSDGHALVADFGIARASGAGDALTATGIAVGTPTYMSPEQASGEREIDARADVYALGAVMYEMLAGEPPFTGPTAQAVLAKSLTETARPLDAVRPNVPGAVSAVVMKALSRIPGERYPSAAEMRTALTEAQDAVRSGSRAVATVEEGPSAGRIAVLYGLAAAAVLAVTWALVRQAGLPRWMFGLAIVLLVIGLPILLAIGRVDAARARGQRLTGLRRFLTWRNAIAGGVLAFAGWGALASTMAFRGAGGGSGGVTRLAVLPFRNQGDSSTAYFVDGIADQLRGKLTELGAVQVIARSSSEQYRGTTKSPTEIGRELNVQYLLAATVVTIRNPDGGGRVHVVPELIDARSGAVSWQQTFDTPLTDLFQVQTEIAVRVAGALDVALGTNERQQLAERPTKSLEAWDVFLKGETANSQAGASFGRRTAIAFYEQAVAMDSSFALAWARMSMAWSGMYFSFPTAEAAEAARRAAERARINAPGSPWSHLALGSYYGNVLGDYQRAQNEYAEGLRLAPNHVELLVASAQAERNLGRFDGAIEAMRRALALDPRSSRAYGGLAAAHLWNRDYPDAMAAADQAIALAPGNVTYIGTKAMVHLAQGDLSGARAVIRSASRQIASTTVSAYFAVTWDLFWVLDQEQQNVTLRLTPAFFDEDRVSRALAFAGIQQLRGNESASRAFADTAVAELQVRLQETPNDNYLQALSCIAHAYAGHREEAQRAGERAMELLPLTKDAVSAPYNLHLLIRAYLLTGEKAKALESLRQLLAVPYFISPGWLRIDPAFDPLRGDPAFEQLARGN